MLEMRRKREKRWKHGGKNDIEVHLLCVQPFVLVMPSFSFSTTLKNDTFIRVIRCNVS